MTRRTGLLAVLVVASLFLLPGVAAAQQALSVNLGYFTLRGLDARVPGDVLFADRTYHTFEVKDFNNVTIGGEWLFPVGDFIEGGIGVGFYQKTVPTFYTDIVNTQTGEDILQDFKLRIVPVTAIARFFPLGLRADVQPYVGAGVGLLAWRYSETGQFVDYNGDLFLESFRGSGTTVAPVVVGGVRFPVTAAFAFGGEVRYQRGEGKLDAGRFNGDRIDLGGLTYQAIFRMRF